MAYNILVIVLVKIISNPKYIFLFEQMTSFYRIVKIKTIFMISNITLKCLFKATHEFIFSYITRPFFYLKIIGKHKWFILFKKQYNLYAITKSITCRYILYFPYCGLFNFMNDITTKILYI